MRKLAKHPGGLGRRIWAFWDAETGQEVLIEFRDDEDPPGPGESFEWNERTLVRQPNGTGSRQHEICVKYDGLFRNYQVGRKDAITRHADGRDKRGTPLYHSRSRARDEAARMRDVGMDVEFDG